MTNYLFVGDSHSDLDYIEEVADLAAEYDATIIQLGDFGFLWPSIKHDCDVRLPWVSQALVRAGEKHARGPVTCRWIDGNHDYHPEIRKRLKTQGPEFAPHLIHQPRGSTYTDEDGTRFLFLGGAPSIDKASLQWMS